MDLTRAGAAGHILRCESVAVDENGVMVLVGEVQLHIPHGHIGAQHDAARPDIERTRGAVLAGDGNALADDKRRHAAFLFGVGKGFALDDDRVAIHRPVQGILKFGIRLCFAAVTHTFVVHICVDGVSSRKCRCWQHGQQEHEAQQQGETPLVGRFLHIVSSPYGSVFSSYLSFHFFLLLDKRAASSSRRFCFMALYSQRMSASISGNIQFLLFLQNDLSCSLQTSDSGCVISTRSCKS